ncbi:unnamed protein product [Mytilus coruscus]|uniref:Inosine/uridine-preferring nucleoside hydrolase domain-containing protein n=1 Tax=Mytilus coruscus TaxID=42192 RepID=A0A6J8E8F0_MYTCO|nr:unnamed protein product [Mytilus coruscus]
MVGTKKHAEAHGDDGQGEITLIALAPLTNVALALRLDPDFGRKLKEVFIMGGNIEAAEANGIEWVSKIDNVWIKKEWYDRWVNMDTRKSRFIKAFSRKTAEFNRTLLKHPKYSPYDLLTMAIAIDQTVITESVDKWCTVEIGGNHTRGQLVVDWANKTGNKLNVRIIKKVNTDKTKAYFMSMAM